MPQSFHLKTSTQESDLVAFFGDWSQSEKLSEIKPSLICFFILEINPYVQLIIVHSLSLMLEKLNKFYCVAQALSPFFFFLFSKVSWLREPNEFQIRTFICHIDHCTLSHPETLAITFHTVCQIIFQLKIYVK